MAINIGDVFEFNNGSVKQLLYVSKINLKTNVCALDGFLLSRKGPSSAPINDLLNGPSYTLRYPAYKPEVGMVVRLVVDDGIVGAFDKNIDYKIMECNTMFDISYIRVEQNGNLSQRWLSVRFAPKQSIEQLIDSSLYCGMFDLSDRKTIMEI